MKARRFVENKNTSDEMIKSLKWTCDLIPSKALQTRCENAVDENVVEILKVINSTMDENAVCSKFYFCNNAKLDKLLQEQPKQTLLPFTCAQCHHVGSIIEQNLQDRDEALEQMLVICGEMSSYSDACSSIVMMNFDNIYNVMMKQINKKQLCDTAGACSNHKQQGIVDIVPAVDDGPNIPCELCEQLVLHLRELLLINTTAVEFKNVLVGFCHQTGQFANECDDLVLQYYQALYNFLQEKLNANTACVMLKICPPKDRKMAMPSMPLVSTDIHPVPEQNTQAGSIEVHQVSSDSSLTLYKNGSWCTTCEYFIHFAQEALRKQSTEDDIEYAMKKTCMELPKKIQSECVALVELYGDAMFSLLDQNMNPRYICPKIKMCPPNLTMEYLKQTVVDEKPTCPFCLLALQDIRDIISSNTSKQNIEAVVSKLCNHLSDKLMGVCTEFVKKYSEEVVEMILADFTPQEACTYIKLCTDDEPDNKHVNIVPIDDFVDDVESETLMNPQCELCKEVMKIVEQRVMNKKSKDEIRRELEKSCSRLKKFSVKCTKFVDKYSDKIVDLIEKELTPDEVCRELMFCVRVDETDLQDYDSGLDILMLAEKEPEKEIKAEPQCVICEFVMTKLEDELNDKKTDDEIKNAVRNICSKMPATVGKSCKQFVDYYFDMIIVFIETLEPKEICGEMKLCPAPPPSYDETMIKSIQGEIYECAICKGLVEGLDTFVEDPYTEANLENLEEKLCEKFAGKYKTKVCQNSTMKPMTLSN